MSAPTLAGNPADAARRVLDVTVAALALLVLGGPMLVIALLIRADGQGPALFRQPRLGRDRTPFVLYKFRTMTPGGTDAAHRAQIAAELRGEDTSVNGSWKLDADPRVTGIGAVLRRTSLDELPQLINVLRGEMTLVGPRPCLPWEADLFPDRFADRFRVRPGLTGLWQVTGRSTMGTLQMLELDVAYVRDRGFLRDLAILALTVPALLRGGGAR